MTIKDEAEGLAKEALQVYYRTSDDNLEDLARIVERLALLVAASAPEFKEAP